MITREEETRNKIQNQMNTKKGAYHNWEGRRKKVKETLKKETYDNWKGRRKKIKKH